LADTKVVIFNADGASAYIDYRTEGTNLEGRQVVVLGDPATNAGVAPVDVTAGLKVDLGTDNDVTLTSGTLTGITNRIDVQRVHNIVDGTVSIGRPDINRVFNLVDGTVSIGRPDINRVHNLVNGTVTVADVTAFTARPDINRVHNIIDGTITIASITTRPDIQRVHNIVDGTVSVGRPDINRVHNVIDGTISTVASITNIAGFSARPDINRVHNVVDGTITVASITARPDIQRVHNVVDGTITVASITNRPDIQRVHNIVDGTMTVNAGTNLNTSALATSANQLAAGHTVQDLSGTATAYYSATGSYAGVSTLGKTIVAPVASRVNKIYAITLTTTAQVGTVVQLTDGAGSATEHWRYALQAPSQGVSGANLAVTPPGYLFATASGSTLAILTNNASLIHYTVAYFRESA